MLHCWPVKYKALKMDPVQSHFVSQYDGGQPGQRDLWPLNDQSSDNEQSLVWFDDIWWFWYCICTRDSVGS